MIRSAIAPYRGSACFWLVVVAAVLSAAPPALAQRTGRDNGVPTKSSQQFRDVFRDVVAGASRSTVHIWCDDAKTASAFGTVVGADGWIVTKASEVKGKSKISCEVHDGREFPARIVGISEPYDLAMLKIDVNGLKPVKWHDSKNDAVGSWVATPGMNPTPVAVGVISVSARKISGRELARRSFSGGFLGIGIGSGKDGGKDGVKVTQVIPEGAAEKAGFEEGDIIIAVGAIRVRDEESLFKALEKTRAGQKVTVRVKRGSEEVELKPKLGPRPQERADFQNKLGSELSDRRTGFPMVLQHDTVLRPVDCGGPLVDLDGKVIGINIARAGRTETLAIPAEAVKALLDDLKSGELAPK